jgi:hypothetical protein
MDAGDDEQQIKKKPDCVISLSDFAETFLLNTRVLVQVHGLQPSASFAIHHWLNDMCREAEAGHVDEVIRLTTVINRQIVTELHGAET